MSSFCMSSARSILQQTTSKLVTTFSRNVSHAPRRSLLYVPGDSQKKLAKARKLPADCVVFDMEDGVAQNRKEEARNCIREELDSNHTVACVDLAVRVNAIQTGLCQADLESALRTDAKRSPTIVLPKTDSLKIIEEFCDLVRLLKPPGGPPLSLITMVESAAGLFALRPVLEFCESQPQHIRPVAVIFGSDDFCADVGITRSPSGEELLYARQKTVAVSKMFGLQAIDMVHIDYKDLTSLATYSAQGARMGFTGKQVIHPAQVSVVQDAFTPSNDKVQWALALITAFEKHQASGKGAFVFRDSMVDMPLLRQAQNICAMHRLFNSDVS